MFEQTFKNIDDVLWKEAGCATELDYTEQTSWILFLKYLDDLEKANEQKAELQSKKYQYIIDAKHRWSAWAAPKKRDGSFDHDKALTGDDLIKYVDQKLFPYLKGFRTRAESANTIEYKIGEIFSEIENKFRSGYSLRDALELMDGLSFRSQDQKHELSHIYEAKLRNMGNAGRNGGEYYTPRPLIRAMIQVVKPKIGDRIYDGAAGSAGFLCETFDYLRAKPDLSTKDLKTLQEKTFFGKEKKSLAYVIAIMNMILHGIDTRKVLLASLAERGFAGEQLAEISRMINAEKSDLFDVLAYIAYALAPITRSERVETHRSDIFSRCDGKLQSFLDFVLGQYVKQGVGELDQEKLGALLQLKYHTIDDATSQLGSVPLIRDTFLGFQQHLYAADK
jgi:type I restriction-modification system DNA methylase subunit